MSTSLMTMAQRYAWLIDDEFAGARREGENLAGGSDRAATVGRSTVTLDDGALISSLRWGAHGVRAMLLHGGGLNAHSWDSVLLRTSWGAIAPDLPGHGDSSWLPDFDYRASTLARAMLPFVVSAATAPFTLVGHSLGGLAAIEIAAALPELVASLVIVDITPGRRPHGVGSEQIRQFVSGRSSFDSYEDVVEHALATGIGTDREALERGVILNTRVRADGQVVFKHHFAAPPAEPSARDTDITYLWNCLEQLTNTDIHLVRGRSGFVRDDEAREFATRLPLATVTELEGGHNVHRDAPQDLADLLNNVVGGR